MTTADHAPAAVGEPEGSPPKLAAAFDDQRLIAALEDYSAAVRAGRRPDREAFLRAHPEIAPALTACLEGLDLVARALPELSQAGETRATADVVQPAQPLGDFEIVREVGRGGMGVVYEAVQLSLGRRVALKVLPFASTLDAKQLQRFKNEAHAAAQLHHTNIVPVHATGCERGVHYYAMQYIDGQTVAGMLEELRPHSGRECPDAGLPTGPYLPSPQALDTAAGETATPLVAAMTEERSHKSPAFFRTVARLGVQAALALEHAHGLGVIHRDIKPGNLLVDMHGNLWITDFGLAHCQSQAGLTMTGDLVGTLRYMSPEQALAQRVTVDHRTDIYSLGLTLYELLTLEPAFAGRDRQQLLQQIAFEEPCPPRRVNETIPAELETIVLKATEKNPAERYASAQDLADDLERFLNDEPIRARRPTLLQRAARWCRRHKPVVWSTAVLLVMATLGLAVSNVVISHQKAQKQAALEKATQEAAKARAISELLQEMLETANPDQANGAAYTVHQMLDAFSARLGDQLKDQPEAEAVVRATIGRAYQRLGMPEKAETHLKAALELQRRLNDPDHEQVAQSLVDYAWNLRESGDHAGAEIVAREAVAIYRKQETPGVGALKAWRLLAISLFRQLKHAEGEAVAQEALALAHQLGLKEHPEVPCILHALAESKGQQGYHVEAERLAREAVEIHRRVHGNEHPETAWGLVVLGQRLGGQGKHAEAEPHYREALAILQKQYPVAHKDVVMVLERLAATLRAKGDHAALEMLLAQMLREANKAIGQRPDDLPVRIYRGNVYRTLGELDKAIADFSEVLTRKSDLVEAWRFRGDCYLQKGQWDKAIADFSEAIRLRPDWWFWHERGYAYLMLQDYARSVADLSKAIELTDHDWGQRFRRGQAYVALGETDKALEDFVRTTELNPKRGEAWWMLTDTLRVLGKHEESAKAARQLPLVMPDGPERAARALAACVSLAEKDTGLSEDKRKVLAQNYADEAMKLLQQAFARGFKDANNLRKDASFVPLRSRTDFQKLLAEMEAKRQASP
jgi:serine/threonine protein kinase/Flp pilus assembly protein TadD